MTFEEVFLKINYLGSLRLFILNKFDVARLPRKLSIDHHKKVAIVLQHHSDIKNTKIRLIF